MAKSIYKSPLTEAITFGTEGVMTPITIPGSGDGPGVGAPARNQFSEPATLKYI